MLPSRPTLYALGAILLWATQALVLADRLPYLNLHIFLTFSFFVSALTLALWKLRKFLIAPNKRALKNGFKELRCLLRKPFIWVGIITYFLYHYLLFRAIDLGPVITANLLNFAWPVFFVLISERFFHTERTQGREKHIVHTKLAAGFFGCILLLMPIGVQEKNLEILFENLTGPIVGLLAAIVWAIFTHALKTAQTKINKRQISISWATFPIVATLASMVTLAALSLFSDNSLITNITEWKKVFWPGLYFGLMPLGIAMIFYDKAVRQVEEAERLGRLLFLTPLFSTLLLLLFARTEHFNMWGYLGVGLIILVNMNLRDLVAKISNIFSTRPHRIENSHTNGKLNSKYKLKEEYSLVGKSHGNSKKANISSSSTVFTHSNLKQSKFSWKKISKKIDWLKNELLIPNEREKESKI